MMLCVSLKEEVRRQTGSYITLTLVLLFTVARVSWDYHDLWWGIGTQLYLVVGFTTLSQENLLRTKISPTFVNGQSLSEVKETQVNPCLSN